MVRSGGEIDSSAKGNSVAKRRWRVRIGHLVFALLLCGTAVVLSLRWHWRHEFHKRIEAIRAAGYPATPQELEAWYKYPQSGANAARWIMGAGDLYVAPAKEDWEQLLPIVFRTWHSEPIVAADPLGVDLMSSLERHVHVNSTALKSLYDAATIDECRYPTDLSPGAGVVMTPISHVREGVPLLCLEAVLHAERGDPNRAAKAIQTALHVTDTLEDEPVMVSHMVAAFGASLASTTLSVWLPGTVSPTSASPRSASESYNSPCLSIATPWRLHKPAGFLLTRVFCSRRSAMGPAS